MPASPSSDGCSTERMVPCGDREGPAAPVSAPFQSAQASSVTAFAAAAAALPASRGRQEGAGASLALGARLNDLARSIAMPGAHATCRPERYAGSVASGTTDGACRGVVRRAREAIGGGDRPPRPPGDVLVVERRERLLAQLQLG